ncbi:MAG: formylglycine-generating enzyme family protein [Proteiniphilum sp.]|nr:formylglycine-generating enzyme family protein [Proteiniphilum sp.]
MNKDTLFNAVLAATGGKVYVKYNVNGDPLYMVRIPKFNVEDLDPTLGSGVHPAFVVDGVIKNEIFIGAYQAIFEKGYAISIPGCSPKVSINFDQAKAACTANGPGFHLMTNWEWAAVALWCLKNGFQPRGNTNYLKSHAAPYETGTPAPDNPTAKTLGGSGPVSWRHDNSIAGIADLVGNVWEWQDGFKIVDGKVYMPVDNDFNLAEANWPNPTGAQVIFPASSASESGWRTMATTFGSLSDAVKKQLAQAMIVPNITSGNTPLTIFSQAKGGFWITAEGERFPIRGGAWSDGASAGVASLSLSTARSNVYTGFGCRAAFIV